MKTSYAALRRLTSFLLLAGALVGVAGSALAQVTMDTRPASPRVGDFVTLDIAGYFPRDDFWVVESKLFELRRRPGTTNEYIAEVDIYYFWRPNYLGPAVRTFFATSVPIGQFEAPGTVEVQIRALPLAGVPVFFDVTEPVILHFDVGSGTPTCTNEVVIGRGADCTPTLSFGTYRFGERSIDIPVEIRNGSRDVVYLGAFELDNADYGMTRRCGEALEPSQSCHVLLSFSPSISGASPGRLTVRHANRPDAIPFQVSTVLLSGDSPARNVVEPTQGSRVVEYHAPSTDGYFITANENEMRTLDAPGSGWRRTGLTFIAMGDFPVCRFYGDVVGGPRGHFYTARVDQCEALRTQDTITPRGRNVYRYEGTAFGIGLPLLPANDERWRCPESSRAIYQLKRPAGGGRDQQYRYIAAGSVNGGADGDDLVRTMLRSGWSYEGHVMCSGARFEEAR